MIPELIDKLFEDEIISQEQHKSLTPIKKPYGTKLANFLITGEFTTQDTLKTFFNENKHFLYELFNKFLNR